MALDPQVISWSQVIPWLFGWHQFWSAHCQTDGDDKNHTSLGPCRLSVLYAFVFTSDYIYPEEYVVIGSMVRSHTHGFGVYFHVFGVCRRVWYELQRPRSESSIYASNIQEQNESIMDQRPRLSPTKMDYSFPYQGKPQAHHTKFNIHHAQQPDDVWIGLGHWCLARLHGKANQMTRLISLYCPCKLDGPTTTYQQHIHGLAQLNHYHCPFQVSFCGSDSWHKEVARGRQQYYSVH